ncbi:hypothetical protein K1719_002938 [Acacia pycnantha]|nr:hypothetical protein K1719_002938 [Acacia pycnantha]
MNVIRYCNLDESLQDEDSLACLHALERLYKTRELDYMSYFVLRMFENTEVALDDPKRFRMELTFSRGADLSPLEVMIACQYSLPNMNYEATVCVPFIYCYLDCLRGMQSNIRGEIVRCLEELPKGFGSSNFNN